MHGLSWSVQNNILMWNTRGISAQADVREKVVSVISEVFALHGAVRMSSHDIGTVSNAADASAGMAQVLMQTGKRAALRYEMRRPFASWLVRQAQRASQSALLLALAMTKLLHHLLFDSVCCCLKP
jgi:hypothetical protein